MNFKDMNDSELYWFAVHFLNGAELGTEESDEIWSNFMKEVNNRSEHLQYKVDYLMEVI